MLQAIYHADAVTLENVSLALGSAQRWRLADRGTLYSFAIVHRSFPGVETPFISAIVDLDGGGTLKGNLRGLAATPETVRLGMAVKVVIDDALGRRDKDGNAYLAYFFEPAEEPSA